MKLQDRVFAFDLDGTVTLNETLPLLARELDLEDEIKLLTELTMAGKIPFNKSFKLRYHVLRNIPVTRIQEIMSLVMIDEAIEEFIKDNLHDCVVVTGNLDVWIKPIVERLGCAYYSSKSTFDGNGELVLKSILNKGAAIRALKKKAKKVVAIGESFNDIPMFEESSISIAYGGVHKPVNPVVAISDYVVMEGDALCRLLRML